jgi:hypothetical protein
VCASAFNLPTVYLSGIVEAQPTAFEQVRTGFAGYLAQHFSYKGAVACMPTNNLATAQKAVESRTTALRNTKKNVVNTGWTEGSGSIVAINGAALAPAPASSAMPQASARSVQRSAPVATTAAAGGHAAAGSASSALAPSGAGSSGGTSNLANTLNSIFGAGSAGCSGGGNGTSAGGAGKGDKASGAPSGTDSGCQSPYAQVSSTLTSLFGSAGTSTGGAQGGAADPAHNTAAPQQEGLGSAEAQSTKLVVYGCGRHDTQIACVTDLTNENQQDTLVLSDVWKDAFIVDDRGDRHPRSKGFFLNVDGDQRSQLDIGYGKSARFVLLFDGVQSKVQKVALRCASAGLDVEDISLMASVAGASPVQAR